MSTEASREASVQQLLEWRENETRPADEWFYVDGVMHGHIWFGGKRWWHSYRGFVKTPTSINKEQARGRVEKTHQEFMEAARQAGGAQ